LYSSSCSSHSCNRSTISHSSRCLATCPCVLGCSSSSCCCCSSCSSHSCNRSTISHSSRCLATCPCVLASLHNSPVADTSCVNSGNDSNTSATRCRLVVVVEPVVVPPPPEPLRQRCAGWERGAAAVWNSRASKTACLADCTGNSFTNSAASAIKHTL